MKKFDWHSALISSETVVDESYKNTQNVRRFMIAQCGEDFRFTRDLMQWIKSGNAKTMKDVVAEYQRRQAPR